MREQYAKTLFDRFKQRARATVVHAGSYANDEWERLPASFKRSFYEDADAILALRTAPASSLEGGNPWGDLKVAFPVEDSEPVWAALRAGALALPDGWELNETDCSGGRCVAIFRVAVIPTRSDGEKVAAALAPHQPEGGE